MTKPEEPRLLAVQVIVQWAEDDAGEIGTAWDPVAFSVSPAEWKRGWDWQAAFATFLKQRETVG